MNPVTFFQMFESSRMYYVNNILKAPLSHQIFLMGVLTPQNEFED